MVTRSRCPSMWCWQLGRTEGLSLRCENSFYASCWRVSARVFRLREGIGEPSQSRYSAQDDDLAWVAIAGTSLRNLQQFGASLALPAHPQPIPEHDCKHREHKNDRGHCIDLGSDAAPQTPPNLKRKRVVPANEEKAHCDLV